MKSNLFCLGYGYTAQYLHAQLNADKWKVKGTSRNPSLSKVLKFQGIQDFENINDELQKATHILVSIPPESLSEMFHGVALPNLKWLGVLSSTGVYGDHQGAWVDETSICNPTSESGRLRLQDENEWLKLYQDQQISVHIFRLSGIYGPGRNYFSVLKSGRAERIHKEGTLFSRIHIEDIVQALILSMEKPTPGEIYNLADDFPAASSDVVSYAAELMGVAVPPLIPYDQAELSPMLKAFYQDSKKISNEKIKKDLGFKLKYPTYREGLKSLIELKSNPVKLS